MSYIVVKTIKGRQYRYLQRSYREGEKVRTESTYLGPANGKRRGILTFIGDQIRREPGSKIADEMMENGLKMARARENAEKEAEDAFYTRMNALYGMVKGPSDPVLVDKLPMTAEAVNLSSGSLGSAGAPAAESLAETEATSIP